MFVAPVLSWMIAVRAVTTSTVPTCAYRSTDTEEPIWTCAQQLITARAEWLNVRVKSPAEVLITDVKPLPLIVPAVTPPPAVTARLQEPATRTIPNPWTWMPPLIAAANEVAI